MNLFQYFTILFNLVSSSQLTGMMVVDEMVDDEMVDDGR